MRVLLCSTHERLHTVIGDRALDRQLLLLPVPARNSVLDAPGEEELRTLQPWTCVGVAGWADTYATVVLLVPASTLDNGERRRLRQALVSTARHIQNLAVPPDALALVAGTGSDDAPDLLPFAVECNGSVLQTSEQLRQKLAGIPYFLFLEGDVCAEFELSSRRLTVRGPGSALIFTVTAGEPGTPVPIRLDALVDGMSRQW